MRKKLLLWLLPALLLVSSLSLYYPVEAVPDQQELVWICTGKYSKKYHKSENGCKGMRSCKGDKYQVTLQEAQDMGRTACGFCY